jgi:hypothetical protein
MGISVSPIPSPSGSSVSPSLANPRQAIGAMALAAWRVVVFIPDALICRCYLAST